MKALKHMVSELYYNTLVFILLLVKRLSKPGEWAGMEVTFALSRFLGIAITVHQLDLTPQTYNPKKADINNLNIFYSNSHFQSLKKI